MKAAIFLSRLKKEYGLPGTTLCHDNPWQLMVATMLSAQCTDKRVNRVTPFLFAKYRTIESLANADENELKRIIRSTGYYNQKAKRIKEAAKTIMKKYGGKIPEQIEELVRIPGVGRKTANIIITYGFGGNQGIAVDTHVRRLSFRLGLTKSRNPIVIERDLKKAFRKKDWPAVNTAFIEHGRRVCKAAKPLCSRCVLKLECPKNGVDKHV
ncbi:MAG: endonuclease III [archaeon]